MSEIRDSRPLPRSTIVRDYRVCYARVLRRSLSQIAARHIVETESINGHPPYWKFTLCDIEADHRTESGTQGDITSANCAACKRIYKLIMAVTDQDCPGSGRPWFTGDGHPICKVCHYRPAAIGARVPRSRTYPRSGWRGRVPAHAPRTTGRKES